MSKEEIKQHFAEICETIWGKIESQQQVNAENAESMRQIVTNFAMIAWNMCLIHKSFPDTKKVLQEFAAKNYESSPCALIPLLETAELKWHEYPNDKEPIASVEVKIVNGKPKAIAYLEGECPEDKSVTSALEQIIGKIAEDYNASLAFSSAATNDTDDEVDDEDRDIFEQDFPITREELDAKYQFMRETPQDDKKKMLAAVLKMHPYLAPLCKDTPAAPLVADVILAVFSTFIKDSHLFGFGDVHFKKGLKLAQELVSDFIDDKEHFPCIVEEFGEPNLFTFLAETVDGFKLPQKVFKKTLSTLLAWGFMVESSRIAEHPDRYDSKFQEDEQEEYDFDEKNLHALQLHVKLLGYRCSADVLVREDCTFEDLHDFLNPLFNREDDHLYRFECEDGCTAVRDEEDIDDDEMLSNECYVGHHLSPGAGAYYLFDYGDEWEHDISVKKVTALDPKVKYPKVLKITGKIPEQYPDYDEEEDGEE